MRLLPAVFGLLALAPGCNQTADIGDPRGDGSADGGQGTCTAPYQLCDGDCVDLLTNPLHCGRCANPCESGCNLGRCASPTADGGSTSWDGGNAGADGGAADAGGTAPDVGPAPGLDAGGTGHDAGVPLVCGGSGTKCVRDSDCCPSYECDTYYGWCTGSGCATGDCDKTHCCAGLSCQYDFGSGHSYCETAANCVPEGGSCDSVSDCCLGTGCVSSGGYTYACKAGQSCRGSHQTCATDSDCCPGEGYSCRTYRYDGKVCVSSYECGVIATPCGWDGVDCCSGYTCRPNGDGTSSCSN